MREICREICCTLGTYKVWPSQVGLLESIPSIFKRHPSRHKVNTLRRLKISCTNQLKGFWSANTSEHCNVSIWAGMQQLKTNQMFKHFALIFSSYSNFRSCDLNDWQNLEREITCCSVWLRETPPAANSLWHMTIQSCRAIITFHWLLVKINLCMQAKGERCSRSRFIFSRTAGFVLLPTVCPRLVHLLQIELNRH